MGAVLFAVKKKGMLPVDCEDMFKSTPAIADMSHTKAIASHSGRVAPSAGNPRKPRRAAQKILLTSSQTLLVLVGGDRMLVLELCCHYPSLNLSIIDLYIPGKPTGHRSYLKTFSRVHDVAILELKS